MSTLQAAPQLASSPRVPCPVCGASSELAWRHPEASLHRCPSCDHCFSDPASIDHQEEYGPDYYEEMHRNWFNNPNIKLFRRLHGVLQAFNPRPRVLDVGCGNGNLLAYLHQQSPSWQLTGVDICALPTIPGVELRQGDAFEIDLGRKFDVVISLAVIEHVADVQTFVRKLRELCVPGGLVIVLTVNDRSLTYATARFLRCCGLSGPFNRLYSKHHVNHFNFHSLRQLLTLNGLEVRETIRHHSPLAAVDVPAKNPLLAASLRGCAWSVFQLERLTGRTILQTVISQVTRT
jgi:SAM-dependent methyltransferase